MRWEAEVVYGISDRGNKKKSWVGLKLDRQCLMRAYWDIASSS